MTCIIFARHPDNKGDGQQHVTFVHVTIGHFLHNDKCTTINTYTFINGLVGSMPLQLLEIGFHVEIHAIEWHDFQRETQFHGVVVA